MMRWSPGEEATKSAKPAKAPAKENPKPDPEDRADPCEDPDVQRMMRVRNGDHTAFRELFAKYGDSLLNLAFRFLGTRARAEELVQEAFLRVYRARGHYEPRARFRTYISRVVVNLCFNELRRAERQVITESLQDAAPDTTGPPRDHADPKAPSGEAQVAAGQIHRRVESAIAILPSKQKTALLLTKFDGYSYQQVAEVLDTTSDAVKALVARATRKLREELEDLID
jgi:RNA polymerase sigma-70 factor, ECF subfamily